MNSQKKTKLILVIAIIIIALASTGCERTYEEATDENLATPEMAGDGFTTPLPAVEGMEDLLELGAQTAAAEAAAGLGGDTPPGVATSTAQPVAAGSTETLSAPVAASVTPPVLATTAVAPPTAVVGKPSSYTLKQGEFPYCIARRFNVDPKELLNLNGITSALAQTYQPGLTLSIPQSSGVFPPPRARHAHPISYTVPQNTTVYGVACFFGDIDPATITSANTIPDPNNIAANTVLQIP